MQIRDSLEGDEIALNLTPLIDVVFQLLVFFMAATTFLDQEQEREIEVDLPLAAHASAPEEAPEDVVISVARDGSVTLGGAAVDRAALEAALLRAAARDPRTPVTIRGDRHAHHEAVVGVMDACGAAGLSNLAVGTLEAEGG
jgi:biopolymer transport protein ExbD